MSRVIQSKRDTQTGENFFYCPATSKKLQFNQDAIEDRGVACDYDGACRFEKLPARFRVHCALPAAEMLQPTPAKAVDSLPRGSKTIFDTPQHMHCEPKIDGARVLIHFLPDKTIKVTGRRRDKSGSYNEYTQNLPQFVDGTFQFDNGSLTFALGEHPFDGYTILDGEIVMPVKVGQSTGSLGSIMSIIGALPAKAIQTQRALGYAEALIFDVLYADGDDVRDLPLDARRALMHVAIDSLHNPLIHAVTSFTAFNEEDKKEFFEQALNQGFEGAVFKNAKSKYGDSGAWLKCKQEVTVDAQVVGWEPGARGGKYENTIGALVVSVIDSTNDQLREVCRVVPGDDALRDKLFQQFSGLSNEEITNLALIVELYGQGWTKDYHIRHPRIKRWRPDRSDPNVVEFYKLQRI